MTTWETFLRTTTREKPVLGINSQQLDREMKRLRFTKGCQAMLWSGRGSKAKPQCAVIHDWTVRSDGEHIFVSLGQGLSAKTGITTLALCLLPRHYRGPTKVRFYLPGIILRVVCSFLAGDFTLMSLTVRAYLVCV